MEKVKWKGQQSNDSDDENLEDTHYEKTQNPDLQREGKKKHPVDTSGWWSFATFSWMSPLMFSSYRHGLNPELIPKISYKESCHSNTDELEQLWIQELKSGKQAKFSRVIWRYVRTRIILTTIIYLTSICLGFIGPTIFMKKVLEFSSDPDSNPWRGILWVSLLIFCEFARVFFFTLTWAMSYRTAIRLRTACMGMTYRKLLRLGNLNDYTSAKLINVISSDCARIYEVIITTQLAVGGPVVLILCVFYIATELGIVPLIGILIFPLAYPLQYLLAKGSGSLKRKAISIRDDRVTFMSQALHYLKFLKMFAWETYYRQIIAEIRLGEKKYLQRSQLLQSLSIVITPTLPHIGAIVTFLFFINTGNDLTPATAFCIIAIFSGRIRPSLNKISSGFRAYFDALIAITRMQSFVILFLFSLFGYTIRSVNQLFTFYYSYVIFKDRMESVLYLPEVRRGRIHPSSPIENDVVILNDVTIIRRAPPDSEQVSHGKSKVKMTKEKKKELMNKKKEIFFQSIDKLLNSIDADVISFQLNNLNLSFQKGSFVGICGQVGSGKTTLLEGIAGALSIDKGTLDVFGKIAYVPQEPWIFKGTLRENITFGEDFEPVWYYNTINSCCLVNDFAILPSGDLTETLENGSNLSGGQKQRVSLARALYQSNTRDIFLLDDPFSGLDTRVAKTIFEKVVLGQLRDKGKTVILVTHQMQFLRSCHEILVFSDGNIVERGTHDELMDCIHQSQTHYAHLMTKTCYDDVEDNIMLEDSEILDCSVSENCKDSDCEKTDSASDTGNISWSVYYLYIKSAGGIFAMIGIFLAFGISIGSTAFSSWWLKNWFKSTPLEFVRNGNSNMSEPDENGTFFHDDNPMNLTKEYSRTHEVINKNSPDFEFNRDVYAGIIGVIFLTCFVRTILFVYTSIRASQALHCQMLSYFFRNRLKSSERVGTGQILNLFSKDMEEIDVNLPNILEFFLQNIFICLSVFTLVTIVFPVFIGPLFILFLIFIFVRRIYNEAIRDLKRLESQKKTPIFTSVQETVSGLGTIRAFAKEPQMLNGFDRLSDSYHSVYFTMNSAIRWLSIRLDVLAVTVTATTAILVVIFHGKVSAAAAGLALSYAAQLSGIFQFTVRLATETEAKFVSVERMRYFLRNSQPEEPELFNDKELLRGNPEKLLYVHSLPDMHQNWPFAGHVKFDSVFMSYSLDSEAVLRNLSFEVFPGQKIGIIGRTGSGKSSIGSALFRLTELKSGQILIDDVDICEVSLSKLRNSLCVIPQEPAIFQNSIRFNLDPAKSCTDDELWNVLEKTGLKSTVDSLDVEVGLSQGQKQLLSIARALLRRCSVIFVDEATSNVDLETAAVMDRLLADEFRSSTIFIVAHRLSALSYCDHLLIMEDGECRDFGPVEVITKKPEFTTHFEKFESVPLL